MKLTEDQTLEAIAALTGDGDSISFSTSHGDITLRLHIGQDPDSSINDYDCYGSTSRYAYRYGYGEGHTPRPDHMDGSARKIEVDRGLWMWWQPPDEFKSAKAWDKAWGDQEHAPYHEAYRSLLSLVTDLLQFGFNQVGVSVHETLYDSDGHGHEVEVRSSWIGGVDSTSPDAIADIVSDLLADLFPEE